MMDSRLQGTRITVNRERRSIGPLGVHFPLSTFTLALPIRPVVALTSHARSHDDDRTRAAGCVGYIIKPIDTRNFCRTLAGYL